MVPLLFFLWSVINPCVSPLQLPKPALIIILYDPSRSDSGKLEFFVGNAVSQQTIIHTPQARPCKHRLSNTYERRETSLAGTSPSYLLRLSDKVIPLLAGVSLHVTRVIRYTDDLTLRLKTAVVGGEGSTTGGG